jgi:uncharacterized protein YodC (DUF2158 family)
MRAMEASPIRVGDQVRHRATGRRMLVRSLDGDMVRCAWFDGRYCLQATVRRVDLIPCSD